MAYTVPVLMLLLCWSGVYLEPLSWGFFYDGTHRNFTRVTLP